MGHECFHRTKQKVLKNCDTLVLSKFILNLWQIFFSKHYFFYLVLNYSNILNEKKSNKRKTWTLHQYFAGYENWNITIPYSNYDERGNQ